MYETITKEIKMSIKEVANILEKDESTIRKIGKSLFPDSFRNGIKTYLDEEQITIIKLHLGKNSQLPKTSLEKELIIQQAMLFQSEKINSLRAEIITMKPKAIVHDQILDSEGLILPSIAGKIIMGHPNKFTEWCLELGILFKRNSRGKLVPGALHQNAGYLTVKTNLNKHQNKTYEQAYFTPKGLIWITKIWNKHHPFNLESV